MKTKRIFFSMIGLGLIMLMSNCAKEATETKKAEKPLSQNDLKIGNTIKSFKSKVAYYEHHPDLKSSETIAADSALWLLESTINYSHAFPNEFYNDFVIDSLSITVTRNADGSVDWNELTQKYNEMKQAVSDTYHNVDYTNKGLSVVDLTTTSVTETQLTMNVQTVTGQRGIEPPSPVVEGPFQEGDDWWYGEMAGKCSPHTYISDASKQLRLALNGSIPALTGNFFFITPTTINKKGGELNVRRSNDPEPRDNVYDYYLYSTSDQFGTINDAVLCLNRNEMNTYFGYLEYLLFTKIPNEDLPGYCIINVADMFGTYEYVNEGQNIHYYHKGAFEYGILTTYRAGEGPVEL